jgi:membrane fusion protein, multidrug efflux system
MTMAETPAPAPIRSGPFFYALWIGAVVIVLCLLGGLVLARDIWISHQTSTLEHEEQLGPIVVVVPVTHEEETREVVYPGAVHGYFESPIYAKVAGYVDKMFVDKGDRVKKNQLLCTVVSPELDQQVANALASYKIAAITNRRYQDLVNAAVVAQQIADEAKATMQENYAQWQSLKAEQGYEQVLSPFDGVITARNLDPGALVALQTAAASTNPPIYNMATLQPVRVYVQMPQDDAAFINDGDHAAVMVTQLPRHEFIGSVTRHPQALMQDTRTMLVEVDLPNNDFELLPGMFAHVKIKLKGASSAPLVPDEALVFEKGKVYVPIINGDRIHLAEVTLGYDDGIRSQIVKGLAGNEKVALNLGQAARDGEVVRPLEQTEAQQ